MQKCILIPNLCSLTKSRLKKLYYFLYFKKLLLLHVENLKVFKFKIFTQSDLINEYSQ